MRWRVCLLVALVFLGGSGVRAAPNPQAVGRRAFVSNEFGGDITIIDTQSDQIVGRLVVGPPGIARPRGLALSPDGRTVYVAVTDPWPKRKSEWEFYMAVDVASGRIIGKYPCGSDPERLTITPDGRRMYCSNEDEANVTAVDLRTNRILATIPTGIEPEGVGVSPDGRWVYVTSETSHTVTVVDTRTNEATKHILVGTRPRVVVFAPDGKRAYVSAEIGGTLSICLLYTSPSPRDS